MRPIARLMTLFALLAGLAAVAAPLGAQGGPPPGAPPGGLPPQGPGRGGPPGGRGGGPPLTPRQMAPVDLTGNWVSVVIEDWRFRMMTPRKGDLSGLPLTDAARRAAEAWDPARDEAAGEQCRAYGAPGVMRLPGRVRISWQDDTTLKLELDNGQMTRLFHFGAAPAGAEPSWQGYSVAEWEREVGGLTTAFGAGRGFVPPPVLTRSLKVTTTRLRPGYVRKNGAPYSANAVLTEYFDLRTEEDGQTWFTVVSIVDDPGNFTGSFITSSDFKKEPDGSKWTPAPCSAK